MKTNNNKTSLLTVYYVVMFIVVCVSFFINDYFYRKSVHNLDLLTFDKCQDTVWVERPAHNRGSTHYDDNKVADTKSYLVENQNGFDDWLYRRKVDPEYHNLGDVAGPYYLYKAANNDTIVIIKDDYVLKFKMPTYDTVSRYSLLKRFTME